MVAAKNPQDMCSSYEQSWHSRRIIQTAVILMRALEHLFNVDRLEEEDAKPGGVHSRS